MIVIGLCGGSGSGKGAVSEIFGALGIPSVDTDAVYHELISHDGPCLRELSRAFGDSVVRDGALDRATLRNIVFTPPDVKQKQALLNSITHKYVIERTERLISYYSSRGCVGVIIDAPLLFESGLDKRCDLTVAVVSDTNLRIARIMIRDGIDYVTARRRIDAQLSDRELIARTDHFIRNDGGLDELKSSVSELYNKIFVN